MEVSTCRRPRIPDNRSRCGMGRLHLQRLCHTTRHRALRPADLPDQRHRSRWQMRRACSKSTRDRCYPASTLCRPGAAAAERCTVQRSIGAYGDSGKRICPILSAGEVVNHAEGLCLRRGTEASSEEDNRYCHERCLHRPTCGVPLRNAARVSSPMMQHLLSLFSAREI